MRADGRRRRRRTAIHQPLYLRAAVAVTALLLMLKTRR